MASKATSLRTFLTEKDEDAFSRELKIRLPRVKFISYYAWETPEPPIYDSLLECRCHRHGHVVILNEDLLSQEEYKQTCVYPHPSGTGYLGAQIGHGMIQFFHSRVGRFVDCCLGYGGVAASYDAQYVPDMHAFVKTVWAVIKKNSLKVYLTDQESGKVDQKAEPAVYAWPDAAVSFNGVDKRYLTLDALTFLVAK